MGTKTILVVALIACIFSGIVVYSLRLNQIYAQETLEYMNDGIEFFKDKARFMSLGSGPISSVCDMSRSTGLHCSYISNGSQLECGSVVPVSQRLTGIIDLKNCDKRALYKAFEGLGEYGIEYQRTYVMLLLDYAMGDMMTKTHDFAMGEYDELGFPDGNLYLADTMSMMFVVQGFAEASQETWDFMDSCESGMAGENNVSECVDSALDTLYGMSSPLEEETDFGSGWEAACAANVMGTPTAKDVLMYNWVMDDNGMDTGSVCKRMAVTLERLRKTVADDEEKNEMERMLSLVMLYIANKKVTRTYEKGDIKTMMAESLPEGLETVKSDILKVGN